ncbi:MAG: TM0106 family RecB-like putative nuclease [Deltaproteobacteria bacterium]|nr:TM0106 family RecB-like putative nuclease [Deltaproteobacteria bacterium]
MQYVEGVLVVSPTDLVGYLACTHKSELDRYAALGQMERPERDDPELKVLTTRGGDHEKAYKERLSAEGNDVVTITVDGYSLAALRKAEEDTVRAMRAGAKVIYQAAFFDGRWRGHADFLLRVERPSRLGAWSYEVSDTKLTRQAKADALLQMLSYSEHVARIQGAVPQQMHVVTGDGVRRSFRVTEFAAYFRRAKAEFEAWLGAQAKAETYPEPVAHCGLCPWEERCTARRKADDHLSLVAGMRRDQTRKLIAAGIPTTSALARLPADQRVKGIGTQPLTRLREQAGLQVRQRETGKLEYRLLPQTDPTKGFALLPTPSPGDVFFDMEGDPHVDGGLEYLFGAVWLENGSYNFKAFWAHNRAEEKQAFEAFIDFVAERRARFPDLHVYHYASYERTAVSRLMGTHGTREEELDVLLRNEVFVDLYRVVMQTLRISQDSYSIKALEAFYMGPREGDVKTAASSIVAYEEWLRTGDPALLESIRAYNEVDCRSTQTLRDWLEARRSEAEAAQGPIPRPELRNAPPSDKLQQDLAQAAGAAGTLLQPLPAKPESWSEGDRARWLLAQLIDFHRRAQKPEWWAYYDRLEMSERELFEDPEALAGLEFQGAVTGTDHLRFTYDRDQEHKIFEGASPVDPAIEKDVGDVVGLDIARGEIDLRLRKGRPIPRNLIPSGPPAAKPKPQAIWELANWVGSAGPSLDDAPGPYRALRDLLLRRPPRISGHIAGAPLVGRGELAKDAARRIVHLLDDTALAIQGPPGTGKTTTGARLIVDLVRAGKKVGITANSHKVIVNLLDEACDLARKDGVALHPIQKTSEAHQRSTDPDVRQAKTNIDVQSALSAGTARVAAGTPWLFAAMREAVDVLFVDEAGQVSLADVLAAGISARNVILLGDPQQLAQPGKATHPPGAEASALEHLLGDNATIPEHMGLFLETTHRMHPDICRFVSEVVYEGRLEASPECARQRVDFPGSLGGTGLRIIAAAHRGNRTSSEAEGLAIASAMRQLVGSPWVDNKGDRRTLGLDDILVVTPFNAQVARLTELLVAGARIGTVDKFQGQQAAVTFYSMASSSAEDAPRAMEFLYELNRLNVAVSRARALSILVFSPELLRVRCRTPEQLRLANALCQFAEQAVPIEAGVDGAPTQTGDAVS